MNTGQIHALSNIIAGNYPTVNRDVWLWLEKNGIVVAGGRVDRQRAVAVFEEHWKEKYEAVQ
jgi:hypothetical protein